MRVRVRVRVRVCVCVCVCVCNIAQLMAIATIYFFYCNNYRNERHLFFKAARDFQPLNTILPLDENDMVDNTLNSTLFRAVHDYIKST